MNHKINHDVHVPKVYQPPTIFDVSIYASKACSAIHIGNSNMHGTAYALSLFKLLDRQTLQFSSNHTHPLHAYRWIIHPCMSAVRSLQCVCTSMYARLSRIYIYILQLLALECTFLLSKEDYEIKLLFYDLVC